MPDMLPPGWAGGPTGLWSDAHLAGPFGDYGLETTYVVDDGVLQIPLSAPVGDQNAVLVQLHAPVMRKTVRAGGSRSGAHPILPSPTAKDLEGGVRAGFSVVGQAPQLDGDSTTLVTRSADSLTFLYETKPFTPEDGYRIGHSPVSKETDTTVLLIGDFSNFLT